MLITSVHFMINFTKAKTDQSYSKHKIWDGAKNHLV